jgi:hypothetical protein
VFFELWKHEIKFGNFYRRENFFIINSLLSFLLRNIVCTIFFDMSSTSKTFGVTLPRDNLRRQWRILQVLQLPLSVSLCFPEELIWQVEPQRTSEEHDP